MSPMTHAEIAKIVGKSRPEISNKIRLLELPPEVQKELTAETITAGHARALATIEDTKEVLLFVEKAIKEGLSVRELERQLRERFLDGKTPEAEKSDGKKKSEKSKDPYIADLEKRLEGALATKVRMTGGDKAGRIVVNYYSAEDLERILKLLGVDE